MKILFDMLIEINPEKWEQRHLDIYKALHHLCDIQERHIPADLCVGFHAPERGQIGLVRLFKSEDNNVNKTYLEQLQHCGSEVMCWSELEQKALTND